MMAQDLKATYDVWSQCYDDAQSTDRGGGNGGAELITALDLAMTFQGEIFPGALVLWAKK